MVKVTSSGPSSSKPYVKLLRAFRSTPTYCGFCDRPGQWCYWITQDPAINLSSMRMSFGGEPWSRTNCVRACRDCVQEMGLLW
jgi:hypothetical protein